MLFTLREAIMPNVFDTSSIPDDAEYWRSLSARVMRDVRRRRSGAAWVGSRPRGWMLTAYAAAAAVAIAALLAAGRPRRADAPAQLGLVLAPNDALGKTLSRGPAPPPLTELEWAPSSRAAEAR
jgi:hypothetical protein